MTILETRTLQTVLGATLLTREGMRLLNTNYAIKQTLVRTQGSAAASLKEGYSLLPIDGELHDVIPGCRHPTKFLAQGSEGVVYALTPQLVVKAYTIDPADSGIDSMQKILRAYNNPDIGYDVVRPLLATKELLVMENLAAYPDYYAFAKLHPALEKALYDHIDAVNVHEPRFDKADVKLGNEFFEGDAIFRTCAVFVKSHDDTQLDIGRKFRIAVSDFV